MSSVNKKPLKQRISERIKAGMLTTRLEEFALTTEDDPEYDKKKMSPAQVTAAFKLLAKVVPDLKQVEFDGKVEQTVTKITREIIEP